MNEHLQSIQDEGEAVCRDFGDDYWIARHTDGLSLFCPHFDRDRIDVQRTPKMGRNAVDSNMMFFDDLFISDGDLIGEKGRGFGYIQQATNPEHVLTGAEAKDTKFPGARRVYRLPAIGDDAWRHGRCQGIPRGAVVAEVMTCRPVQVSEQLKSCVIGERVRACPDPIEGTEMNVDEVLNSAFPDGEITYSQRDVMLYAPGTNIWLEPGGARFAVTAENRDERALDRGSFMLAAA